MAATASDGSLRRGRTPTPPRIRFADAESGQGDLPQLTTTQLSSPAGSQGLSPLSTQQATDDTSGRENPEDTENEGKRDFRSGEEDGGRMGSGIELQRHPTRRQKRLRTAADMIAEAAPESLQKEQERYLRLWRRTSAASVASSRLRGSILKQPTIRSDKIVEAPVTPEAAAPLVHPPLRRLLTGRKSQSSNRSSSKKRGSEDQEGQDEDLKAALSHIVGRRRSGSSSLTDGRRSEVGGALTKRHVRALARFIEQKRGSMRLNAHARRRESGSGKGSVSTDARSDGVEDPYPLQRSPASAGEFSLPWSDASAMTQRTAVTDAMSLKRRRAPPRTVEEEEDLVLMHHLRQKIADRDRVKAAEHEEKEKDLTFAQRHNVSNLLVRERSFMEEATSSFLLLTHMSVDDPTVYSVLRPSDGMDDHLRFDSKKVSSRQIAWRLLYALLALLMIAILFLIGIGLGGLVGNVAVITQIPIAYMNDTESIFVETRSRSLDALPASTARIVRIHLNCGVLTYGPSTFHTTVNTLSVGLVWLLPKTSTASGLLTNGPEVEEEEDIRDEEDLYEETMGAQGHARPSIQRIRFVHDGSNFFEREENAHQSVSVHLPSLDVSKNPHEPHLGAFFLERLYKGIPLGEIELFEKETTNPKIAPGLSQFRIDARLHFIKMPGSVELHTGRRGIIPTAEDPPPETLDFVMYPIPSPINRYIFWSRVAAQCRSQKQLTFLLYTTRVRTLLWIYNLEQPRTFSQPFSISCEVH